MLTQSIGQPASQAALQPYSEGERPPGSDDPLRRLRDLAKRAQPPLQPRAGLIYYATADWQRPFFGMREELTLHSLSADFYGLPLARHLVVPESGPSRRILDGQQTNAFVRSLCENPVFSQVVRADFGTVSLDLAEFKLVADAFTSLRELRVGGFNGPRQVKPLQPRRHISFACNDESGGQPVKHSANSVKVIDLQGCTTSLEPLRHLTDLESLSVTTLQCRDFAPLKALTKLTHLRVEQLRVEFVGEHTVTSLAHALTNLPLGELDLAGVKFGKEEVEVLPKSIFKLAAVFPDGLAPLSALPLLAHLSLLGEYGGVRLKDAPPTLESLAVRHPEDDEFGHLAQLPRLRKLTFVSDHALYPMVAVCLPHLTELNLARCDWLSMQPGLDFFKVNPQLQRVVLPRLDHEVDCEEFLENLRSALPQAEIVVAS